MKYVIANWKMNLLHAEAQAFCDAFLADHEPTPGVEVGIAPPFPLLREVSARMAGRGVRVLGQNGHQQPKGAFTGEVSMAQLRDAGCTGVLLGHSERRHIFGESDETIAQKLVAAWELELLPVLCIGETLTQRDAGFTLDTLRQQISILQKTGPGPLVVAYEPVWAIGTGRVAQTAQIEEAHEFIREELWYALSEAGRSVPILYGGSVTPDNFAEILKVPNVAGGLVGGASLDPAKFTKLVRQAQAAQ